MARWAIAGTGNIASKMAQTLQRVEGAQLVAVASRATSRADAFAHEYAAKGCSFEDLLRDPEVDVVYVASPHSEHCRQSIDALNAGKHVLVEKPASLSHAQTSAMVQAAQGNHRFLMEAMWTRFLPAYEVLRTLLADKAIGEVLEIKAELGSSYPFVPEHRIYRKDLGGGALLDIGVYALQLALMVFGEPTEVSAHAQFAATGVDHDTAMSLGFGRGRRATLRCSLIEDLAGTSRLVGTEGWLELDGPLYSPQALTYQQGDKPARRIDAASGGDGWRFQALELERCLATGAAQSPFMSWEDSLTLAMTLDRVRSAIGLEYPGANTL